MTTQFRIVTLETIAAKCLHEGDCWLWQGYTNSTGTPACYLGGQRITVRRAVLALQGKPALTGQQIASSHCGQRLCVNPAHIHVTTRSSKLTQLWRSGHTNEERRAQAIAATWRKRPGVKLSIDIARQLRASPKSALQLERETGISHHTISKIRRNQLYRDIVASPWAGMGARKP